MTRVRIETMTRPGVPNVNGVIYSLSTWNNLMDTMKNQDVLDRKNIIVAINYPDEWSIDNLHNSPAGIPVSEGFGVVSIIAPTYIIVDVPSCIEDDPKIVNLIRLIHAGKVKAYMAYRGLTDHKPDDAYVYLESIHEITGFYLGYADPANSVIDVDAISKPKKKKKKSKKQKMASKIKQYTKE